MSHATTHPTERPRLTTDRQQTDHEMSRYLSSNLDDIASYSYDENVEVMHAYSFLHACNAPAGVQKPSNKTNNRQRDLSTLEIYDHVLYNMRKFTINIRNKLQLKLNDFKIY